jgi:hypothetical protein
MHAMKAYEGRDSIASLIVNLDFTFQLLYPPYLFNSKLCEPQIWSGGFWRREIVLLLPGIRTRSLRYPPTVLTEISRLPVDLKNPY